jgi:hypothetical protein
VGAGDSTARIALNPRGGSLIGRAWNSEPQALKRHAFSLLDGTTKVVPFPSHAESEFGGIVRVSRSSLPDFSVTG